ncbi:hypothetical protein [Streptomyces sp. 184]|uniref:hypothetical protein n=1 Tax=Streptomyces sp. 184 TaxID=1827526 RepID=UPI003891EF08
MTGIVAQLAGGAATAAGAGAGQAVYGMVVERLSRTEEGRAAVAELGAGPDDPEARRRFRTVLAEAVEGDEEFARGLAAALAAPPPPAHAPVTAATAATAGMQGSISIAGSTVKGRTTISPGPVTMQNPRVVRVSLAGLALVLVALLGLGTYFEAEDPAEEFVAADYLRMLGERMRQVVSGEAVDASAG